MTIKVYQELASRVQAVKACKETNNTEWVEKHGKVIDALISELTHGSGIDGKYSIDHDACSDTRLVLACSYHAMDDHGYYDGWIDYTVTVKASLAHGFTLKIKGNFGEYQDIKEYLYEVYQFDLLRFVDVLFSKTLTYQDMNDETYTVDIG